jgi:hypothetical protein
MLSWDLHIHPGSPAEGRWGDGAAVRAAASRAGVKGLVWKSHEGSTEALADALSAGSSRVIPSIVLNPMVTLADVRDALDRGVRWIWSPSREADGSLGWDLALPRAWDAIAEMLRRLGEPVVLATSHLSAVGRQECASLASDVPSILCTVTHSLYLDDEEVTALARLGAVFEADLYTMTRQVRDVATAPLAPRADLVHSVGSTLYLTSDAGQAAVGDPYVFVRDELHKLRGSLGDRLRPLTVNGPERVARHLFPVITETPIEQDPR